VPKASQTAPIWPEINNPPWSLERWGIGDDNDYPWAHDKGAYASTENLLGKNSTSANLVAHYDVIQSLNGYTEAMYRFVTIDDNINSYRA
jgi:hypothetical protein